MTEPLKDLTPEEIAKVMESAARDFAPGLLLIAEWELLPRAVAQLQRLQSRTCGNCEHWGGREDTPFLHRGSICFHPELVAKYAHFKPHEYCSRHTPKEQP